MEFITIKMKKLFILFCAATAVLTSCKETGPYITLTPPPDKVDTTYVLSAPPAAEPHQILVEEFTGASCSNCPEAHEILHVLDSTYPGRLNIIALHDSLSPLSTPPHGAQYDFRAPLAWQIANNIFSSSHTLPCGGVDRLPLGDAGTFGSNYLMGRNMWNSVVPGLLSKTDSMNLKLTSNYDAATGKDEITLTVTYTAPVSVPQNFTIALIEDSIVDVQEFPGYYDDAYHFDAVFRTTVTKTTIGDTLLPSVPVKEAGRVYKVTYRMPIETKWKAEHCRLVAYVHGANAAGGVRVYQSAQTKVIP